MHPFEAKGLGKPPYQIWAIECDEDRESQCQCCGTRIKWVYSVGSDDSVLPFKIGSTCIKKGGDKRLKKEAREFHEQFLLDRDMTDEERRFYENIERIK